jgi:hypothetical protein
MPLNKALIDAINNRPHADEPDVAGGYVGQLTAERPTPAQLFLDGDRDELARRRKAELSPDAYALAFAWANAVESETGDYYADLHAKKVALIARHFPAFEMAMRAVSEHIEDERAPDGLNAWPECCAWPAVDDEGDPAA